MSSEIESSEIAQCSALIAEAKNIGRRFMKLDRLANLYNNTILYEWVKNQTPHLKALSKLERALLRRQQLKESYERQIDEINRKVLHYA